MPSKRLEEAMKAIRYTNEKIARPSNFTGKSQEEHQPPPRPARTPQEPAKAPVRQRIYRKPGVRETSSSEASGAFGEAVEADGQDEGQTRAPRPVRAPLPPDPFPLQYLNGDKDKEFECE
jgi:hypothetical protein